MKKFSIALLLLGLLPLFVSCNDNDDVVDELGQEILIDPLDVDCCSAEEARQVYEFLRELKELPELTQEIDGKYRLRAFSPTGTLLAGYNDIYFVVTKIVSSNYVKDIDITGLSPLMAMSSGMKHSTPVGSGVKNFDNGILAVRHGWVSFLMPTSEMGSWTIDYDVRVLRSEAHFSVPVSVSALPEGVKWQAKFNVGDDSYVLSIVNPNKWTIGSNVVSAYVSAVSADKTKPYLPSAKSFVVEIVPTMPDMGNHSAPDGDALKRGDSDLYTGSVNFTMTGWWRLHLTIRDADGKVVAGGDAADDGFSSLSLDVVL